MLAGLAATLLTARIGSMRPNIALGWELDIVTMVVLGGVAITGGSGTIRVSYSRCSCSGSRPTG